jgi:starch-binding outer membrane protein, SusD/RagB family
MKKTFLKYLIYTITAALLSASAGCNKEYADPSKATEDVVFSSARGLTGVAVGLQRVYTSGQTGSLYNTITASGFLSNELFLVNSGQLPESQLNAGGGNVDGTNNIVARFWENSNKIIYDADLVITNAEKLEDKGYASGLIAYSTIFKALALGNLSTYWEQVPSGTGTNVTFIPRVEGFNKAIEAIDKALAAITSTPISGSFLSNIPPGLDIVNTLNALKARHALSAGNYNLALSAANSVDLSKKSAFSFDVVSPNTMFTIISTNNFYQPIDNTTLGLPAGLTPDPADKRIPFYTLTVSTGIPTVRYKGFAVASNSEFPIYLPGEVTLIKAEAYARQSTPDLVSALTELNKVVTKTPAADPFGVGADLPAIPGPLTQEQLLDQIYKHKSIELFMTGMRFEDARRLRPVSERKRNFLPYPFRERDNNPNTPADPGN